MNPQSGIMLAEEIAPRLRVTVPKMVTLTGGEDAEELVQDAIAVAAQMLHNVEMAGKEVTAGNIAYYTLLHMKSGRRSQCRSRADVMAARTQLDQKSSVHSLEEEVGYDPELDQPITLGELLAVEREDPSVAASRNVDWELFIESHDYRYGVIVKALAEGEKLTETAKNNRLQYSALRAIKAKLEEELREFLGDRAMEDCLQIPKWRAGLMVDREKAACRASQRRSSAHR